MARGRPKKLENEVEYTEIDKALAHYLSMFCGTPGCMERFHLTEARTIILLLKEDYNYIFIKESKLGMEGDLNE